MLWDGCLSLELLLIDVVCFKPHQLLDSLQRVIAHFVLVPVQIYQVVSSHLFQLRLVHVVFDSIMLPLLVLLASFLGRLNLLYLG